MDPGLLHLYPRKFYSKVGIDWVRNVPNLCGLRLWNYSGVNTKEFAMNSTVTINNNNTIGLNILYVCIQSVCILYASRIYSIELQKEGT